VITQFINRLKLGKPPIIYGDGKQTRDFVYVEDVVEASIRALNSQNCVGEVINVGTGKPAAVNEIANVLMELFEEAGAKPEYGSPRAGDIQDSYADIGKAGRVLGYRPKIRLEEGIKRLLQSSDMKAEP
jgi:nucleoside-diphosphate-sugar epimerase